VQFGQLVTYFRQGGPMMWPLLFFSLIALIAIIERFIVFARAKINVNEFLTKIRKALLVNRNVKEAIKVCEQYQGPVASVMKAGLLRYGHTRDDIEKTIENAALYELDRLEKRLGVLATTANVAPMLGFLGTVVGMIQSFGTLAQAGLSNPGAVAAGIAVALITTAAGLSIAIPAQLGYNYFMSRINGFLRDIETASNMLLETFVEMDSQRYGHGGEAGA
jgi:biopolymer transport protein ExbB